MATQMYVPLNTEIVLANTDVKALSKYENFQCIALGATNGAAQRAFNPSIVRKTVEEFLPELEAAIGKPECLILVVGLGGVTGTVSAAVLAKRMKERSIPVVVAATVPFSIEGERRRIAQQAVQDLNSLDLPTLVVDLADFEKSHGDKPMVDVFRNAVQTLTQMVQSHVNEAELHV